MHLRKLLLVCILVGPHAVYTQVTLHMKSARLMEIFERLPRTIPYYLPPQVNAFPLRRDIDLDRVSFDTFKERLASLFPITYSNENNQLVVNLKQVEQKVINVFVHDSGHHPLPGTTIAVKETGAVYIADRNGRCTLPLPGTLTLVFSHISKQRVEKTTGNDSTLDILMADQQEELRFVVVNLSFADGYQHIPKSMATGAYSSIDMRLFRNNPAGNIIDRLTGQLPLLSGAAADPTHNAQPSALRGNTTIYGNRQPLIILDNFPFTGNTSLINPNDIDSITLIKDAAAGAIWGTQAGNGVLVLTTKKAPRQRGIQLSFTEHLTTMGRPDNRYQQGPDASQFVDFEKNIYQHSLYSSPSGFSPVQDILDRQYKAQLSGYEANQLLDELRTHNTNTEIAKYLGQQGFYQQYALALSANVPGFRLYGSLGADINRSNQKGNHANRLSSLVNFTITRNNFEGTITTRFSGISSTDNAISLPSTQPYWALKDSAGRPAAIPYQYPAWMLANLPANTFLDWHYYPLQEAALADNVTRERLCQLGANMHYRFLRYLKGELFYQFTQSGYERDNNYGPDTYFTRNLVNLYHQNSPGMPSWPVPKAPILDRFITNSITHNIRLQLNGDYESKQFAFKAIVGLEQRQQDIGINAQRIYGIGEAMGDINFAQVFNLSIPGQAPASIPYLDKQTDSAEHFRSYYFYGAISYKHKYVFSASMRKDQSNRFAYQANNRGIPLWSVGSSWHIDKEKFYDAGLPELTVRLTYGIIGNIDYVSVPFVTLQPEPANNGTPVYTVANAVGDPLSWERQYMFNTGIDFRLKSGALSGSIDYYRKHADHVLQLQDQNPTSGISLLKNHSGLIRGYGVDLNLQTSAIVLWPDMSWSLGLLCGFSKNQLISPQAKRLFYENPAGSTSRQGDPVDALYAFPLAGLDHENGTPWGWLDGKKSRDYTQILNDTSSNATVYAGPSAPVSFGCLTQTFRYKHLSAAVMLLAKAGYYIRKRSLNYYNMYYGHDGGTPDFNRRWQKPGDELITNVPAVGDVPLNPERDLFYQYSTANIVSADHIRLQSVMLGYCWEHKPGKRLKRLETNVTVTNLGILWRANKLGIDPDVPVGGLPAARSYTLSIKANF